MSSRSSRFPLDDPLLGLDNVILTPHWSASTSDVWRATGAAMAEGMLKAACGERPDNVVNPQVFDQPAFREKLVEVQDVNTLATVWSVHGIPCPNSRELSSGRRIPWSARCGLGIEPVAAGDISALDQHFNQPGKDISPWIFVPGENIKEFSTEEHPGLATIYEAGRGSDIKGILKQPIKIGDYRLPWEFQTSLVQSFNLMAGVGAKTQVNAAIGLNVAVTFSDPSTWPADRTKRPPRTREFQLLVVHLGCTGEAGVGLPQYSNEPHPETYLVWGRGDLGHTVMGDWRIPYVWIGDGARYAGPASPQLFFRCVLQSPTQLAVGIKFDASHGWNMRTIDCSEFGPITGVWEIGPIISADRWIPDVLCRNLPQVKGPHPLMLGGGNPAAYHPDNDSRDRAQTRAAQSEVRILRRLLRLLWRRAAAFREVLRRIQHPRLSGAVASAGAVHAHGHALASGPPHAQAARPGAGDGLRRSRRVSPQTLGLSAPRGRSRPASSLPTTRSPGITG